MPINAGLVTSTLALGRTPPLESVTVPWIPAVVSWANAIGAIARAINANESSHIRLLRRNMLFSLDFEMVRDSDPTKEVSSWAAPRQCVLGRIQTKFRTNPHGT